MTRKSADQSQTAGKSDRQDLLFADPGRHAEAQRREILAAVERVVDSRQYVLGQEVSEFESEFGQWLGLSHAVGVASGTDAITLSLRGCGVGSDDEVITVANAGVPPVAAICAVAAVPVFVDVDPQYLTLDPAAVEAAISPRTRAIVVVHLYGQPAEMPALMDVANRHGLFVIEDCAQAHGASLNGRTAGCFGHAACFSFYPTKNLAALGDAGLVATADADLAERLRRLRQYGWDEQRISREPGWNSRLDELQAGILRFRLKGVSEENAKRRSIAQRYRERLEGCPGIHMPAIRPDADHVFHLFTVNCQQRDDLRRRLSMAGIGTGIHYSRPVYAHPAFARFGGQRALPITESHCARTLSLPMHPYLDEADVVHIANTVVRCAADL